MDFIVIYEFNNKETEVFLHYCQWTGNERELSKLIKVIEEADNDDLVGDVSFFQVSCVKIHEYAVDVHTRIKGFNNFDDMFQKHTGVFNCPEFTNDSIENAHKLDSYFYGCRIGDYFKAEIDDTSRPSLR
jgi:hypothetical protein